MKVIFTPYIFTATLILLLNAAYGQNKPLSLVAEIQKEQSMLSSLENKTLYESDSPAFLQAEKVRTLLQTKGYLGVEWTGWAITDSTYQATFKLGPKTDRIVIDLNMVPEHWLKELRRGPWKIRTDKSITLDFAELETFISAATETLQSKGQPFSELSLDRIEISDGLAHANLIIEERGLRRIDKVTIRGYEDFPDAFLKHRLYISPGDVFNKEKLEQASRAVNNLDFAEEAKPPEVLFTADSTTVYLYLKRKKANAFDGLLGFASQENGSGLELNGYLDLQVRNLFNGGERVNLYWKSNGNDRQRFFLEAETPYIFNSPLLPRVKLEIYRQDSTFSNVRLNTSIGYGINRQLTAALLFSTENSNDLARNSGQISAYQNYFGGISLSYGLPSTDPLFPSIFHVQGDLSLGSRRAGEDRTRQNRAELSAHYLLGLGQNHYLFFQNRSAALRSDDYLENELFRIGGIRNLRGVNEESIFASLYSIFNLEYRYKTSAGSYFFTITDAAYIENRSVSDNTRVISLGLGYSFSTKMGRVALSYANGKFNDAPFDLDNSKVHVQILNIF